jgi:thiol:disulfide interchange protein
MYVQRTVFTAPVALAALPNKNVILINADLTRDDAPGWKLLNELGQTGIPLTAVYAPHAETPALIPSIYTTNDLLAVLPEK